MSHRSSHGCRSSHIQKSSSSQTVSQRQKLSCAWYSQEVPLLRRITQVFSVKFPARVFLQMSSEFTFGDNSDKSRYFKIFFMNLVDRDLTEHQITPTLTLSRLDAQLEQTRRIRLFNQTSYPSFVVFCPMQFDPCESVE